MIDLKPACHRMVVVLAGVTDEQLVNSTPCADYSAGDLIDHVDQLSRGFAAVAHNGPGGMSTAREPDVGNLAEGWRESAGANVHPLGAAWDDPAAWRGTITALGLEMPAGLWGKIALAEVVVHGWDIATATGQPFGIPEATLRACGEHLVDFVPNVPVEGLWEAAVPVAADAPLIERVVAITGRVPANRLTAR